jgi:hypothetical protein
LSETATKFGFDVHKIPRWNPSGLPYLKDMYYYAAKLNPGYHYYGYSNGDILYSAELISSLTAVAKEESHLNATMVIGRRTDLYVNGSLFKFRDIELQGKLRGKLHPSAGIDYFFIARNVFPWKCVPDLVIGRPGFDNFMVALAVQTGVSVVDATNTLVALHQTDLEGIGSGHRHPDNMVNRDVIGDDFNYDAWTTESSQFVTARIRESDFEGHAMKTVVVKKKHGKTRRHRNTNIKCKRKVAFTSY